MKKDKLLKVSKTHTRYYTSDKVLVPGVTTVVGLLNKPALVIWANRLGLQGIDSTKYTDKAAKIGTLIHELVESSITGREVDMGDYSKLDIDMAMNGLEKFTAWRTQHNLEPIYNEYSLVSDRYKYGGTCDFYCVVDGVYTLVDFKSGKGIYPEHFLQVSAYANLLEEQGLTVEQIMILNIGRDENEPFIHQEITMDVAGKYFEIFKNLLNVYYLKKEVDWK